MRRRRAAATVLVALVATLLVGPSGRAMPSFAPGFYVTKIETGFGPGELTDFAFLPGGSILAVAKCGALSVVDPSGPPRIIGTVAAQCAGDTGLLGLALAPDYAATGHLYLLYTRVDGPGPGEARLGRWTASPPASPTALAGEVVVLDGIPVSPQFVHTIGTVLAEPDGTLFVGSGDAADHRRPVPVALGAQELDSPRGKILRITPDGNGVPSNPFFDAASPSSWRSRVFAYGLRNPFRFARNPATGSLYVGDVGLVRWEEIDVARGGENFGWPCFEGWAPYPAYEDDARCRALADGSGPPHVGPLHAYPHVRPDGTHRGAAVTGGVFADHSSYPDGVAGAYLFGDYVHRRLFTMEVDHADQVVRPPEHVEGDGAFAFEAGAPVAIRSGPAGTVHYADIISGRIFVLEYTTGNRPPFADARASPAAGALPLEVLLSAERSYDADGDPLTYEWDPGDGSEPREGATITHTYTSAVAVRPTVTVVDPHGARDHAAVSVHPGNRPPELDVSVAPPGPYSVGDLIRITGSARDPEDGDLAGVRWRETLHHCVGADACHRHPGVVVTGPSFETRFRDHDAGSFLEVIATARDAAGSTTSTTVTLRPRAHTLTVRAPAAAPVLVNGEPVADAAIPLVAGSHNDVAAALSAGGLEFVGWSDGGPPHHDFVMPAADTVLTAGYRTTGTYLFAEGTTLPGFREYLLLAAPGAAGGVARVTLAAGGSVVERDVEVPTGGRVTLDIADVVGHGHAGVAAIVEGPPGLVAERAVYFAHDFGRGVVTGTHTATGAGQARSRWLLAEGSTLDGFQEYLTLFNPGPREARVTLSFPSDSRPRLETMVTVAPAGRETVDVNEVLGPGVEGHATVVVADEPIVVERPMYFTRAVGDDGAVVSGGHVGSGGDAATAWAFAEGTVLPGFAQYLTLANPDAEHEVVARIGYHLADGTIEERVAVVPAGGRRTVRVFDAADPAGLGRDVPDVSGRGVSTRVQSDGAGLVVERVLYFSAPANGGHVAAGAWSPSRSWSFAEGTTLAGFVPYVTLLNPGPSMVRAAMTYAAEGAGPVVRTVDVAPGARRTVPVADPDVMGPGVTGFSVRVDAREPVFAERPMYVSGTVAGLGGVDGGASGVGVPDHG